VKVKGKGCACQQAQIGNADTQWCVVSSGCYCVQVKLVDWCAWDMYTYIYVNVFWHGHGCAMLCIM